MQAPLVVFHGNCLDGFGAAFVLWHWCGMKGAEFHPAHYGREVPDVRDRDVFVLDFSFPRDRLERMHERASSLLLLDHHVTAQEDLEGLPYCRFEQEMSGAGLTWRHFMGSRELPWLIRNVEEGDLWRWQSPDAREINAALKSYPLDFEVWRDLLERDPATLAAEGRTLIRYQKRLVEKIVRDARPIELLGYRGLAVRSPVLVSEVCAALYERPDVEFSCVLAPGPGGITVVGLRSRDPGGADVSEIARFFGGGGHRHSAGFRTFEDLLADEPDPADD